MIRELKYVSLKTLLADQDIDHREFFICIKAISIELPEIFKERAETMAIMVGQHISKACDELQFPAEVRRVSFRIAERFSEKLGFKSRIIAASAVSIAVRILSSGNKVSILRISDCLEVTASTVYSYLKNVKIEVLKQKYQEYLINLHNPIQSFVPQETIQEKIKNLSAEKIELEGSESLGPIKTQVPIPVITVERKVKKLKKRRTSQFIKNNTSIFSRFVPDSMVLGSFGTKLKENKLICLDRNFGISSGVSGFTEFEFSPPIT